MNETLPDTVTEVVGPGGKAYDLKNEFGWVRVLRYGAHTTDFVPTGHQPVLWTSAHSNFEVGKPIRGGSPICFPWFGQPDPALPLHGLVRTRIWDFRGATQFDDGMTQLTLGIVNLPEDPVPFLLLFQVTLGRRLDRSLYVYNIGRNNLRYEAMLHDYFRVSSIHSVRVEGLSGLVYADKTDDLSRKTQVSEPLTFSGETDRVYLQPKSGCTLIDPGLGRKIEISNRGCHSLAVWNPWDQKAAKMPDFGNDEWPEMLCLESGRSMDDFGNLTPGSESLFSSYLTVQSL